MDVGVSVSLPKEQASCSRKGIWLLAKLFALEALRPWPSFWLFSATSGWLQRNVGPRWKAERPGSWRRYRQRVSPAALVPVASRHSPSETTLLKAFSSGLILFQGVCFLLRDNEGEF